MRMLFTFVGGQGHLQPLLPIAVAAAAAGHDVAMAGSGNRMASVRALGFEALPTSAVRPDTADDRPRDLSPLELVDRRRDEREFARSFAVTGARRHATALRDHLAAWRPDLLIRDETDFGAAIASEVVGVPHATVLVLAAGSLIRPELVSPPLQALRDEHGLPADPALTMLERGLVLSPFPPSFRSPAFPLPHGTFSFRPHDRVEAASRIGEPGIYVTLGTVFNDRSGDLFERLLAALADVPADVLLTVGDRLDANAFGPQPAHVRIETFVPQAEALPDCHLVVSHGGSGSLMGALAHGLPSVLLPLGGDQPHNAHRAEELGVARSLEPATVTPGEIRSAVIDLLGDEEAATRAGLISDEMRSLPPVAETIPLLVRLAERGS